jgi:hypothetical protein
METTSYVRSFQACSTSAERRVIIFEVQFVLEILLLAELLGLFLKT